jgi:predicted alpha/beta superfamily hydrolase
MQRLHVSRSIWLLGLLVACAAHGGESGEPVTIGMRYSIESKVLKETRTYVVHKPWNYDRSENRYPVIILLDGDTNVQTVSTTADFLSNTGRSMQMLVVGIDNTDRQRDLTPPFAGERPEGTPEGIAGGAPQFLSFVADELIPQLDRTLRTRPTRILVGYSYSGLFTLYTLFNRPELFKAYIAVSPSLWWDNQALAKQAPAFVAAHPELRTNVFMTVANEGGTMLGGTHLVMGAFSASPNTIAAEFRHWPEESHSSGNLRAVYEGIEWLHQFYYTHEPFRAYESGGLAYFDKRFAMISEYLGYEVKIPENVLMELQNILTYEKRHAEAQQVLKRTIALYPNSANAEFDLSKSYSSSNDAGQAKTHMRRSLELFPGNAHARKALTDLGLDPATVVRSATPGASVLRKHAGRYRSGEELTTIAFENGKLFATIGRDKRRELRALSDVEFYTVDDDVEFSFRKGGRGATDAVAIQFPDGRFVSEREN